MAEENKVLTENPLLDEIIWNAKTLARGAVLKDQEAADNAETLETIQAGDLLIAIVEHGAKFDNFVYTEELLKKLPNISEEQIKQWAYDNRLIPEEAKPILTDIASKEFLANYIEYNEYYRRLHGDPRYDPTKVWQGIWIDVNTISDTNKYPDISATYKDTEGTDYQLLHALPLGKIELMYVIGAIQNIINNKSLIVENNLRSTDLLYLKYIGSRSIDYYSARKAQRFSLLYCPTCDAAEVEQRFKDLIEANRMVVLYTIYSEAYRFRSDYYDRFMMIMIVIQTVIDMMVELPEYLIRMDVFDDRTCQYIFESNGVEYFPEIPIKYQVAMVKNLNKLIKFKSTDTCIVDICSIFGCDSIEIFKYYILKDRKVISNTDTSYWNETKEITHPDGTVETVMDEDKNYDLKFVKVPIMKSYDDYIRSGKNIYDYDEITRGDDYWVGDKTDRTVEENIKDMDFTLLRSKYYSVEAVIDVTQRIFELVYFTNILLYNKVDKSKLLISLPNVSNKKQFELVDVILSLYALTYIYYGSEDDIMDTQGKILKILGFNFEADLQIIAEYLHDNFDYISLESLQCEGFVIPKDGIFTFAQLENIYTTNKKIYQHVKEQMTNPLRKETYDAYKYVHDSLFIMNLNMEYFSVPPDGKIARTYTDFLSYKEPLLSAYLIKIKSITDVDKRQQSCVNAIQSITTYLRDYINSDVVNFDNIFSGLPSISMDFIKQYIQRVIDFFKSFKIYTHEMSITYLFQDKLSNKILMIDWMLLKFIFEKAEYFDFKEWIAKNYASLSPEEKFKLIDKVWLDIDTWVYRNLKDHYDEEKYKELTNIIRDRKEYYSHFDSNEQGFEEIADRFYRMMVSLQLTTRYEITDKIVEKIFTLEKEEFFSDVIQDLIYSNLVTVEYHQGIRPISKITYNTFMEKFDYNAGITHERFDRLHIDRTLTDRYKMQDNYYIIRTNDNSLI